MTLKHLDIHFCKVEAIKLSLSKTIRVYLLWLLCSTPCENILQIDFELYNHNQL